MAVEKTYTITVSALGHDAINLPQEVDVLHTVRDALGKDYPNTSIAITVQANEKELVGKARLAKEKETK